MNITVCQATFIIGGDYRDFTECKEILKQLGIEKFKHIEITYNAACDLSWIKLERPKYYTTGGTKDET